jgi:hypothetical protein
MKSFLSENGPDRDGSEAIARKLQYTPPPVFFGKERGIT